MRYLILIPLILATSSCRYIEITVIAEGDVTITSELEAGKTVPINVEAKAPFLGE